MMRFRLLFSCLLLPFCSTRVEAVGAAAAAANAVKDMDLRFFLAGGVCAATSHGITTPLDVIKTRMQAQPEIYDKGVRNAAVSIMKSDGPQVLLAGLGPTVVGYGIEGMMMLRAEITTAERL
jgi:solute carrier family 25 phosphate transporter 3